MNGEAAIARRRQPSGGRSKDFGPPPTQEITPRDAGDSREPNVALVARHQLPAVSPTKYELAIDLKNTKARGIDIPPTVGRADEVTE